MTLEVILQSEFDVSCRADGAEDFPEVIRIGNVVRRWTEAWVVSEIKELRSEIDIMLFGYTELLPNAKVPVGEGRGPLTAVPGVPELAEPKARSVAAVVP